MLGKQSLLEICVPIIPTVGPLEPAGLLPAVYREEA
jgi:hypothetical protein